MKIYCFFASILLLPVGISLAFASDKGAADAIYNTNYFRLPHATSSSRIPYAPGQMLYNETTGSPEWYDGTSWRSSVNGGGAAAGQNNDITGLLALTGPINMNAPVGSVPPMSFVYAGYPANQQGAFKAFQITTTANQPLTGSTSPGSGTSQTYNSLRLQTNVWGPDGGGTILGYKGSELKSGSFVVTVNSDLGTTDNHKSDLVALSGSGASSHYMGDHTLYGINASTNCSGPSSPMPPGPAATQNCWTRQQVTYEADNNLDAAIPASQINTTTYDPVAQTITIVLNTPLQEYFTRNCQANPTAAIPTVTNVSSNVALPKGANIVVNNTGASTEYVALGDNTVVATTGNDAIAPGGWLSYKTTGFSYIAAITASGTAVMGVTGGGDLIPRTDAGPPLLTCTSGQYFVINAASTYGDATIPNVNDPFGHDTVTYPPTANPNYNSSFTGSSKLRKRWRQISLSSDGLTLVLIGPPALPVAPNFGTITNVWIGHVKARYGMSLFAQGDTNAGREAALNIADGWYYGILIDTQKDNGSAAVPVSTAGAIIASDSKSVFPPILYFPQNNMATLFAIGCNLSSNGLPDPTNCAFGATGVDWAATTPTRPGVDMQFGTAILYEPSDVTANDSPMPSNFPNRPEPIRLGASTEAPGVGYCPPWLNSRDKCLIAFQGHTQIDLLTSHTLNPSANSFCNSGTLLFASGASGAVVQATTDGLAPSNSNMLNISVSQSEAGSIDALIQEQGGDRAETWLNWPFMFTHKTHNAILLTSGTKPTPLDPASLAGVGSDIALTGVGAGTPAWGVNISVTLPSIAATNWTATICAHLSKAS